MARRSRSSGVGDFLSAFNSTYGTARQLRQDYELGEVMREKPEEAKAFTAEQGQGLEMAANDGAKVEFDQARGTYSVDPAIGQGGAMWAPEVAPKTTTKFLGKTHEGSLSDAQVRDMRAEAAADVIGRYDARQGLQMRTTLENQRRARSSDERQSEIQGLQIAGLQRAERKAQGDEQTDSIYKAAVAGFKGTPEETQGVARLLNQQTKRLVVDKPGEDGSIAMRYVDDNGDSIASTLTPAHQKQLAGALAIMDRDPQRALGVIDGINKHLGQTVRDENERLFKTTEFNAGQADKARGRQIQEDGLDVSRYNAKTQRQAAQARAATATGAKTGPLERDVEYLRRAHGMDPEQALQHLSSAKSMSRQQFILKSISDAQAIGKKMGEADIAEIGALYDRTAGKQQGGSGQGPQGSNSSPTRQMPSDPALRQLLGIP